MTKLIVLLACVLGVSMAQAAGFKLTSSSIKPNSKIGDDFVFNGMGCNGKNQSPELKWTGAPKDTKAFAVTVYDPDAPTGSGWWHWVVANIPADTTELAQNASAGTMPKGALQTRADFGKPGYGGPCPPPGDKPHHYHFTVYALKDILQVDQDASPAMVGFNIHANKLAEAKFVATYGRPK
jgi:Raf kinase inhibitor-like YbhB/YbcL family protein